MKKTLSMIYRLGYIVFFLWAMFENAFSSYLSVLASFKNISVITNCLCFLCVLIIFALSISGSIPAFLLRIKSALTALCAFILVVNMSVIFMPESALWLTNILLPALFLLDWLLFDKKGSSRLLDVLFMLLGFLVLYLLWGLINGKLFDIDALLSLLGGAENALKTILLTLAAGALMFVLDKLFSGKGSNKLWDIFSYLYRILFLCIIGSALYDFSANSLNIMFFSLKRFEVLFAFLSFLCILLVLIISLVKFKSHGAKAPFPRVKGAFTASAVLIPVWRFVLFGEALSSDYITLALTFICPMMMIFDWILFDYKGKFRAQDPLYWSIAPIVYFVVTYFADVLLSIYPAFLSYRSETLFLLVLIGIPTICYLIYLFDVCFKRR